MYVVSNPYSNHEFPTYEEALKEAEDQDFLDGGGYQVKVYDPQGNIVWQNW